MPYKDPFAQREAERAFHARNPDYNKNKIVNKVPRKERIQMVYKAAYLIYSPSVTVVHTELDELTEDNLIEISNQNKNKLITYGALWWINGARIKYIDVRKLLYA